MNLFKVIADIVVMPVRVAVDVVQLPIKVVDGEDDLLKNTTKGIEKIEEDLDE